MVSRIVFIWRGGIIFASVFLKGTREDVQRKRGFERCLGRRLGLGGRWRARRW